MANLDTKTRTVNLIEKELQLLEDKVRGPPAGPRAETSRAWGQCPRTVNLIDKELQLLEDKIGEGVQPQTP